MWVIILFKRGFAFALSFILFISFSLTAKAEEISAQAYCVIDGATNTVLNEKNAYERLPIASTTKVMTCLLAAEKGGLDKQVVITKEMLYNTEGTSLYLKAGDKISLLDLVKGALIVSGNDAANAVAFTVSNSVENFAFEMNKKAKELGMTNTNFVTASGLDEKGHYSCAHDMALLSSYALKNEVIKSIVSKESESISINGKKQIIYNHNKLLSRSNNFIGLKTGFTKKAGRCLLSAYKYKDSLIICVTLNAPDDWDDHIKLVIKAKKSYTEKTDSKTVMIKSVGADKEFVKCNYSYNVTCVDDVYVKLYYYPFIYCPYNFGEAVGYAILYTNGNVIKRVDIKTGE